MSAGWDHSAAVVDGAVFTWGRGVKGQLGDGLRQSKKLVSASRARRSTSNRPVLDLCLCVCVCSTCAALTRALGAAVSRRVS